MGQFSKTMECFFPSIFPAVCKDKVPVTVIVAVAALFLFSALLEPDATLVFLCCRQKQNREKFWHCFGE